MSYNKIIEELIDENETLEQDKKAIYSIWKKAMNRENNLIDENKKLKEENKALIEGKNIWFDSHRLVTQEKDKLSDELSLKTRQNSILSLEINELKQELKEYRGF